MEDHLAAPRGRGRLRDGAHAGSAGGAPCGDLIRIALEVRDGRVADAGFDASGCSAAQAAGSAVVELVRGRPVLDAARVAPATVSDELGGLSPERHHAAALAADALHRALAAAAADPAALLAPGVVGDPAATPASPLAGRTLVAMSGGVDSAVAAHLCRERGDDVVAVTLELWADAANDGTRSCCSPQAVTHARALAHRMGLPHLTLDLSEAFRHDVVDDFLAEHAAGTTPNPCVRCNGLVRFGAMLALAERVGAERLVTGHYARIARDEQGPLVRQAADPLKDQAYMLARLDPELLDRLEFPLGDLAKPETRAIARAAGLPVADRPDSQDLCFLAGTTAQAFMGRHAGPAARPGEIVDERGRVLGTHDGQHRFTVGQRRGIGVSSREPLYVVRKHAGSNRVVVGPRAALARRSIALSGATLHRDGAEVDRVKLRYRSDPLPCRVTAAAPAGRHGRLELELGAEVHGVAPGQTACLMRRDAVVGWATIRPDEMPMPDSHSLPMSEVALAP
ncbi:MAG TPA: tRNA 2-thiouridine(34) synthase MnmA [Thermoleophilaceae bacterium]